MPQALYLTPTIHSEKIITVNFGTVGEKYLNTEIGKAVKLIAKDTYGLCADGDKIEAIITSSNLSDTGATRGGLSTGGIVKTGYFDAVCPTEALAAGDLVVAGAQPALGTFVPGVGAGDVPSTVVKKAAAGATGPFLARIVGLGPVGSGAAGTLLCAEFL